MFRYRVVPWVCAHHVFRETSCKGQDSTFCKSWHHFSLFHEDSHLTEDESCMYYLCYPEYTKPLKQITPTSELRFRFKCWILCMWDWYRPSLQNVAWLVPFSYCFPTQPYLSSRTFRQKRNARKWNTSSQISVNIAKTLPFLICWQYSWTAACVFPAFNYVSCFLCS
jgi:hypothetical protein